MSAAGTSPLALNRAALEHALSSHRLEFSEAEREEILAIYREPTVFNDIREDATV